MQRARADVTAEPPWIVQLSDDERIALAKKRTDNLVDQVRYLVMLRANNEIVSYTDRLSGQLPRSYAAGAFNIARDAMRRFELVRLCAAWDSPSRDRISVPTVVALIDTPMILAKLLQETYAADAGRGARFLTPIDDDDLQAAVERMHAEHQISFAQDQSRRATRRILLAVRKAKRFAASPKHQALRAHRDSQLAHSLDQVPRHFDHMKLGRIGDERAMLAETIAIVDALHMTVNGSGFMWNDAPRQAERAAHELWFNTSITVPDRQR